MDHSVFVPKTLIRRRAKNVFEKKKNLIRPKYLCMKLNIVDLFLNIVTCAQYVANTCNDAKHAAMLIHPFSDKRMIQTNGLRTNAEHTQMT